jgi:hypothetical protein
LLLPTTNIRQWAAPDFNPDEAICKSLYAQIKTAPHEQEYSSHISALYETYTYHADAVRRSQSGNAEIPELSAELSHILSKYTISATTDIPIADTQQAASAEPDNAEQSEPVVVDLSNTATVSKTIKHRARRLASKLGIGKKDSEEPAVNKV